MARARRVSTPMPSSRDAANRPSLTMAKWLLAQEDRDGFCLKQLPAGWGGFDRTCPTIHFQPLRPARLTG
jgi:hypothetical protein